MKLRATVAALLAMAPIAMAEAHDNCGWCGPDAQALGRALNLGAPVPCYCQPPPPPDRKPEGDGKTDKRVEPK